MAETIRPTRLTRIAESVVLIAIACTAGFLFARYPDLPDILPVRFGRGGLPIGWQYRTPWRVLMPVFVQIALALTLGGVSVLLRSRPHGDHEAEAPDVSAAKTAAEAVALIGVIWVLFQAYAAFALVRMWLSGREGLGPSYTLLEITGVVLSVVAFARAQLKLGRPTPRPFVPEHWRYGQLYKNPEDPALFVPTRDGSRWTLNFGRPVAAALMGMILAIGVVGPAVILGLLLR